MYEAFIIFPFVKYLFYLICILLFILKYTSYTGADSYTAVNCNNSRWKTASQDLRIRRRLYNI